MQFNHALISDNIILQKVYITILSQQSEEVV